MCSSCGFPAVAGHWTDAAHENAAERMRARYRRTQILKRVLAGTGLTAQDGGQVTGLMLTRLSGASVIVPDLEAFWREAGRLGVTVDPLASRFTGGSGDA